MRVRLVTVVAVGIALTGCEAVREMFKARPEVAAEARGQQLKVDRLAALMVGFKGVPMTHDAAEFIANVWVDYTLFAQAIAAGEDLTDSTTAAVALWPEVAEARGVQWHDSIIARRVPLSPGVADSIYNSGTVRLLQHILIRLEPNAEPPARAAARRKADQVYAKVKAGGDFAALAKAFSDDPGSKKDGGFLPPSPRGKWVTAFDSAGWMLAPGELSPIVESPFGFHIIRRPAAAEVRDRLLPYARAQVGARIDSVYLDSLGIRKRLTVVSGAPGMIRAAIANRDRESESTAPLATYEGGALTVGYFLRWIAALGPAWYHDLPGRPDSSLKQFVRLIGQNQLLLQQADSAGVALAPDEWSSLLQRYDRAVDTVRMSLGIAGSDFTDPATPAADRARVAAIKLDAFWDRLMAGTYRPRPLPGQLAMVLRKPGSYSINQVALDRAVELARIDKAKAESTATSQPAHPAPAPGAAPGVAPAPGKGGS
jgi:hypothetical protein